MVSRVPAGRAGRLWLMRRIAIAAHGADQLDRKIRVLAVELAARRRQRETLARSWEAEIEEAQRWVTRAAVIGGSDAVANAAAEPVRVTVEWTSTIGVHHPRRAALPDPFVPDAPLANAAVPYARSSFVKATRAGLDLAVADAAVAALAADLVRTRQRVRMLRRRLLPRLESQLQQLELALEQAEQDDHLRLRRLTGRSAAG
jgi:V/A-type H+-transporting ATPase subunit D